MKRAQLAELLKDQTEACAAAREVLLAGGDFHVWVGTTSADTAAGIYAVRLDAAKANDVATLGGPATARILQELKERPIRLGQINTPDRSWFFQPT